jgi:hypothetical protein
MIFFQNTGIPSGKPALFFGKTGLSDIYINQGILKINVLKREVPHEITISPNTHYCCSGCGGYCHGLDYSFTAFADSADQGCL